MKKIFTFCSIFFLYSTAVALALPSYADSPTDPGVVCADCHSDGRTWGPPAPPPVVTPPAPPPVVPTPEPPPVVTPPEPPPVVTPPVTPPATGEVNLYTSFDASTGTLSVPAILIDGQVWSIQLRQDSPASDVFVLVMETVALNGTVDPATVDPSLLASFNSNSGTLDIPVFFLGQDIWRLRMKLVGFIPSPTFEVQIVNPGIGNLDDDEADTDADDDDDNDDEDDDDEDDDEGSGRGDDDRDHDRGANGHRRR